MVDVDVTDDGFGVDSYVNSPIGTDDGSGSDASALLLVAIQNAAAVETALIAFETTEAGVAHDLAILVAAILGTETAVGSETINNLLGNDVGHGAELAALVHVARDSGHGVELFEFATVAGTVTISVEPLGSVGIVLAAGATAAIELLPLGTVTISLSVAPEV